MIEAVLRPKEKQPHVQMLKFLLQQKKSSESFQKFITAIEIKWHYPQVVFAKAIVNTEHLRTVHYTL